MNTAAQQSFLSIKVSPLKYKGKALFGWFHLKLESTQSSFPLTWVFAQGETQYSEAAPAGSFVHLTADKWHPSCRDGQVEKKTSRACYFAQDPFPLVSVLNGLIFYGIGAAHYCLFLFTDAICLWQVFSFWQSSKTQSFLSLGCSSLRRSQQSKWYLLPVRDPFVLELPVKYRRKIIGLYWCLLFTAGHTS